MTIFNINKLKDFAKSLPKISRLDYDEPKLGDAISEHILNKMIPEVQKIFDFIKQRRKEEAENIK